MMQQARAILEAARNGLRSAGRFYLGPDLRMLHLGGAFRRLALSSDSLRALVSASGSAAGEAVSAPRAH